MIEVVVPARNEEEYLEATLISISSQTIPPNKIIVINDGSTDATSEIAKKYADVVVNRQDRGYSALGTIEIPKVINDGLAKVSNEANHVLICGADCILPPNFIEIILDEMERNPLMVIASGHNQDDPNYEGLPPRGTRIVNAHFWREINNLRYPEKHGWESWLLIKAMQLGYQQKRIPNLITFAQRPPLKGALKRAGESGRGMRALGYVWYYALGRALKIMLKSPIAGLKMLWGYATATERFDTVEYLKKEQRKRFWKRVKQQINFKSYMI